MTKPTQLQLYYQAQRKTAEMDKMFMDSLREDPPTKSEFDKLVEMRPDIYSRYSKFRDRLPDSRD